MCDTFYVRERQHGKNQEDNHEGRGTTAFFAKNSDRDPNEPQYMIFVHAGETSKPKTHGDIPAYSVKHDVWLSKPSWMWGAEMGVNRKGVAVGNEATFNKIKAERTGVLGMDHLRIALELSSTAREAVETIIQNTERFGQGGSGGFEHPLYYHNSYLVTDPAEAYVLETVGRQYAYKRLNASYNISNKLSIGSDFDKISSELAGKVNNFEKHFTNPLVSYFAGAYHREARGRELMEKGDCSSYGMVSLLSDRHTGRVASMRNINVIAGGLVSSQTTASLFYDYKRQLLWYTEGPCPEIQLFKPLRFDLDSLGSPVSSRVDLPAPSFFQLPAGHDEGIKRWKYNNLLFRAVLRDFSHNLDKISGLRAEFQDRLFRLSEKETKAGVLVSAISVVNEEYVKRALQLVEEGTFKGGIQFTRYWARENKALMEKENDSDLLGLYRRFLGD